MVLNPGRATSLARVWNRRSETWHHQVNESGALRLARDRVVRLANPSADESVVDLGSGTGFLTLPIAEEAGEVLGVDVSPAMASALRDEATSHGEANVRAVVADLSRFDMPERSVDVVVSLYALHHLPDRDKRELLGRARRWLRPGGRIVLADMMFGRGSSARDRRILLSKVRVLARRGPAGLWRIAKNLVRFGVRMGQERPASPEFWTNALRDAGYSDVRFTALREEAGIVSASAGPA